ncbi:MAG: glycosyltransferase family 9 protein [Candidatus Eisenbacteria bacterium]|nr:glycosyltransferase family 9 protein [Candidatus Eisenbacteria bacterium]
MDLILLKSAIRAVTLAGVRPRRGTALPDRARVLLLRHDRIGDALLSTCFLDALARHRPGWKVDLLLGRDNLRVLDGRAEIGRRWCYDRRALNTFRLARALRAERYDLAIDLMNHPSLTSSVFMRLMRPRLSAGFHEERRGFPFDIPVPAQPRSTVHIVKRLGELLRALGCPAPDDELRLRFEPTAAARARARAVLEPLRAGGARLCGVNTSAGALDRFWGAENYRAFLLGAARRFPGQRFVVFAVPAEMDRAARIADRVSGAVLAPPTGSFDEFAATIEGMDSVLTPDTSVVHLCAAFGIPEVVLYADENKALVWAPWGVEHRALIARRGMESIPASEAVDAWSELVR